MIISVASGKGGTGKTTISTNFALSLQSEVADVSLLDCDVEEPNGHLFLNPIIEDQQVAYTFVPKIDEKRCNGCGKCADICRFNALSLIGSKVLVFPELCHSCKGCKIVCPEQAVIPGKRELGTVSTGWSGDLQFIQGCSRIGEAMSPPLIKQVCDKGARGGLTIIDAPPGTSCPVITSIKDSDFVVLVTEPTPFGLHDLVLAVETVKALKIPSGIVINRADLGFNKVHQYAKEEEIPILMEIPFDRTIAEAYSRGELFVVSQPAWRDKFIKMYQQVETIVNKNEVLQ